jgi:glycosyltransferase involved in cell wall biosynthesis
MRDLGVPSGAPIVGNVAALSEHKDHGTLLSAMPAVLKAVPGVRFVIVGDGEGRGALEHEAHRRGLAERCLFTGFRADVDRLMPHFSVFCLTSRLEGLGTSLLDAMCFSRPVVATSSGGIPEVVEHRETGFLVPVGDHRALAVALVEILIDERRRQHMGEAGRRRFQQRFTARRMVDEMLGVYAQLRTSSGTAREARGAALDPPFNRSATTPFDVSPDGSTPDSGQGGRVRLHS